MDVLGRSILHRTISNLGRVGAHAISVIAAPTTFSRLDSDLSARAEIRVVESRLLAENAIEDKISAYVDKGVRNVLLMGVDAYIDFDFADITEAHKDRGTVSTRLRDHQGPLNAWILDGIRARKSGLPLSGLLSPNYFRKPYRLHGYVNRLSSAQDLRQLVADAFDGRCAIRPTGTEVKPYVWIEEGASVHRLARVVAPAYIGKNAQVRSGALITRGSNIERGCIVESGTVVEDTSVLANTYLGQSLDISHAVVDGTRFVHLKRNVALEVTDSRLVGAMLPAGSRVGLWVDPIFVSPRDNRPAGGQFESPAQIA